MWGVNSNCPQWTAARVHISGGSLSIALLLNSTPPHDNRTPATLPPGPVTRLVRSSNCIFVLFVSFVVNFRWISHNDFNGITSLRPPKCDRRLEANRWVGLDLIGGHRQQFVLSWSDVEAQSGGRSSGRLRLTSAPSMTI